ncbi:hypothetical protein HPB50_021503 [Hyalomma asiaticum]|uniref:Uncharacterized protein n=1 Tax=Hyalomma asiaticum TaxID=266040 RepID=A0ACB7SGV5_HYAAI|nr:hypothetical protein HPB50_021503 [Hyalomma asiaticum]
MPPTPRSQTPPRPEPAGTDENDESSWIETADKRDRGPPAYRPKGVPAAAKNYLNDSIEMSLDERFAKLMGQMDANFKNAIAKRSEQTTEMFATRSAARIGDIKARLRRAASRTIRTISKPCAKQQQNQDRFKQSAAKYADGHASVLVAAWIMDKHEKSCSSMDKHEKNRRDTSKQHYTTWSYRRWEAALKSSELEEQLCAVRQTRDVAARVLAAT